MFKKLELAGQPFGRLTVICRANIKSGNTFWICQCSCDGLYSIFCGKSLTSKKIQSCGCLRREISQKKALAMVAANTLPSGESAFNLLYANYKMQARKRKNSVPFELTKEQFAVITKGNCVYCGTPPAQIYGNASCNGHYIYNGIDRQDNSLGYLVDNCVAACGQCNIMKSDFSVAEFLQACKAVISYQNQKETCLEQVSS